MGRKLIQDKNLPTLREGHSPLASLTQVQRIFLYSCLFLLLPLFFLLILFGHQQKSKMTRQTALNLLNDSLLSELPGQRDTLISEKGFGMKIPLTWNSKGGFSFQRAIHTPKWVKVPSEYLDNLYLGGTFNSFLEKNSHLSPYLAQFTDPEKPPDSLVFFPLSPLLEPLFGKLVKKGDPSFYDLFPIQIPNWTQIPHPCAEMGGQRWIQFHEGFALSLPERKTVSIKKISDGGGVGKGEILTLIQGEPHLTREIPAPFPGIDPINPMFMFKPMIFTGVPLQGLRNSQKDLDQTLLIFFLGGLVLLFIFSLLIARLTEDHHPTLLKHIFELGQGNFKSRVHLEGSLNETHNSLGQELNRLATHLEANHHAFSRKLTEYRSLFQIVGALNESKDFQELLGKILDVSIFTIGAERGSMMLLDSHTDELVVKVLRGRLEFKTFHLKPIPIGMGVCGQVVKENKALLVNEGSSDPRFLKTQSSEVSESVKSLLCVPLILQNRAMGVINLVNKNRDQKFTLEDLDLLKILAEQACITIQNKKLVDLATKDGLTNLYLNRYFQARLAEEMIRSRRYGLEVSFIILDIDDLKKINDQHGNILGDRAVTQVSAVLCDSLRKNIDIPVRLSSTQMGVMLPETDIARAHQFAERLRVGVERIQCGEGVKVTASFGVASFPRTAGSKEELLKKADMSLYHSKANGKNQVTSYFSI